MDDFDLKTSCGAFKFFFELYNLPFAFPPDDLSKTRSGLIVLNNRVRGKHLPGFTTTKRRKTNTNTPTPNGPPGDNINPFGNPSTSQRVSDAGYELIVEVPMEGWTPLNPVSLLLILVYTEPLTSTMTATVDCQTCNKTGDGRSCCPQVGPPGGVRHTLIPQQPQGTTKPHSPYPRRHLKRPRAAHRLAQGKSFTRCDGLCSQGRGSFACTPVPGRS